MFLNAFFIIIIYKTAPDRPKFANGRELCLSLLVEGLREDQPQWHLP